MAKWAHSRRQPAKALDLDVAGASILELRVTDGGDGAEYDHADWDEAGIDMKKGASPPLTLPPMRW